MSTHRMNKPRAGVNVPVGRNDRAMEPRAEQSSSKRPAPRGTAAYPRKRAVTACQVCRARRTKCDNLKPSCSFCLKTGAQCIHSTVDLSSFDPASLQILSRLDDLESLLRQSPAKSAEDPSSVVSRSKVTIGETHDRPASILPPRATEILERPNFRRILSGEHSTSDVARDVATPANWADDSRALEILELTPSPILLESFWENVHVKNPILDEVRVRDLRNKIALHGFDQSGDSCLLLLLCALGSITKAFKVEQSVSPRSACFLNAKTYFRAAQQCIGTLMMQGGLRAAQCLFFSGVFMATVFDKWAAWRYFSQSLACCQQFISSAKHTAASSGDLTSDRQAVYWSAWKSEVEMRNLIDASDFPLPDHLTYPSFFPTPPAPTGTDHLHVDVRITARQNTSWFFYLSEISMRRLSTRISQDLLALYGNPVEDIEFVIPQSTGDWEGEIEQWVASLDESVSLSGDPSDDDICKWILRGQLLNLYEQIYWPPLFQIICGNRRQGSPITLDDLYYFGNKALVIHDQRLRTNRPGMSHRHYGTMFMIETCTRSALLLLCVALLKLEAPDEVARLYLPDTWLEGVRCVHDMIIYWQSEYPETGSWAQAIRVGLELWNSRLL